IGTVIIFYQSRLNYLELKKPGPQLVCTQNKLGPQFGLDLFS
ncbi:Uncharacterized protein FWK35_00033728, partial [Aphis craccivora]